MELQIHDNLPAAGPARSAYFETRLRRALVGVSHLIESADAAFGDDPQGEDRCLVQIAITMTDGTQFSVVGRRRGLAAAAAHAFECLSARLSQLAGGFDDDLLDDFGASGPSSLRMRSARPAMR